MKEEIQMHKNMNVSNMQQERLNQDRESFSVCSLLAVMKRLMKVWTADHVTSSLQAGHLPESRGQIVGFTSNSDWSGRDSPRSKNKDEDLQDES